MTQYYWKVFHSNGAQILTTARYDMPNFGRQLRRQYPTRSGYSVRRVTVRQVAPVVSVGIFGRVVSAVRALFS